MSTLKITSKGQVTLRKDLLAHLGVGPGETVEIDMLAEGRIVIRAAPSGRINEVFGMLSGQDGPSLSIDDINEIAREGWARQAGKAS